MVIMVVDHIDNPVFKETSDLEGEALKNDVE